MNPFFLKFETPFETMPFDKIKNEHFLPALREGINTGKKEIAAIKNNPEMPTFYNVCEALENTGKLITNVSSVFFNLHSAESNEELQGMAKEFSPLLTEYSNDLLLDPELFSKIKTIYDEKDSLNLTQEESMLLEKQYKGFVRKGALLTEEDKDKVREIDKGLSETSLLFGDNVLKETNSFEMIVESELDLKGLPDGVIEAAAMLAKEKGKDGHWIFTLDYPSFIPFLKYSENRDLREKIYKANVFKACKGNEYDNQENVKKIAQLRHERALILGYKSHADYVLEERMAQKPEKVIDFLNNLLEKAKPKAIEEMNELKKYAEKTTGLRADEFMAWDSAFYSEKLKKEKFSIDDEMLKPFFKLENAISGVFQVASKLYGIRFNERRDIPTYHEDVKTFEVLDKDNRHVGVFYADFFPREGKRNGAWMTSYREQRLEEGKDIRPHVSIVCNFTKPTNTKPSLLSFNELTTLFHEFGHGLHGLMSKCRYESLGGTNVFWDFVELPSQILENWAYEKECLDLFAKHYETSESIPQELIQKIKESSSFHEGSQTLRQISFALLDINWHSRSIDKDLNIFEFEKTSMDTTRLLPKVEGAAMSCSFSHIFQGGYSAGYYSYKWAEVLDADAFEYFKEKGIFNEEVAQSFLDNVLSKGGSEHPMTLYKRFRGQEPAPEALLKRAGLL